MANPRAGFSIAGTLIEVIAAASESTASAFWDLVFCRIVTVNPTNVNSTASALTTCAIETNSCKFIVSANFEA
jgi:hypothetical protein